MHHFEHDGWHINYNSDGSGMAAIVTPEGARYPAPCRLLIEFVASFVRSERHSALDDATPEEILGMGEFPA